MKVCPHCAEELPDEATVCSNCHKDPAEAPAWAVPRRPDEPPPWWSEDVSQPNRRPRDLDGVPAPYKDLEPAVARERSLGIPSKVWVSLFLGWGWGVVTAGLNVALFWKVGLILGPAGYIAGLILGIRGRAEVRVSDRLGQIVAIIAVASNAIHLVWSVIGFGSALRT